MQNNHVVSFGQDVSKVCYVSTNKYLALIMMLDIVASNNEEMLLMWFTTSYRLTVADCRDMLATKVLLWVRKIMKKADCVFQQDVQVKTQISWHQKQTVDILWLRSEYPRVSVTMKYRHYCSFHTCDEFFVTCSASGIWMLESWCCHTDDN
uniref:Uncharacterized protein n=1 Tax=Octopus bimaculoides TaxID=37653 RepID=A0A0L8FVZ8_OCTBM